MTALSQVAPQVGVGLAAGAGATPFVTALLWGKLITLRHHLEAMAEKDKQIAQSEANAARREALLTAQLVRADQAYARSEEARENERKAKEVERERADVATAKLYEVTTEFGGTMVHMLGTFPQSERGSDRAPA